jgi:hypothetical protein
MELRDHNEQESVPTPSGVSSLEDVRTTLAADIVDRVAAGGVPHQYLKGAERPEADGPSSALPLQGRALSASRQA